MMSQDSHENKDRGITVLHNKNGFCCVKLHYSADPDKNEAWVGSLKHTYPSLDTWNQEQELDFTKSTGLRLYPDFKEIIHIKDDLKPIPYNHLLRFWDFGYRHPACIFAQLNSEDQLVLLDEMFGSDIIIKEFGKAVKRHTKTNYPGWEIDDYCDPAGKFKSDKTQKSSIDLLRTLEIYPHYKQSNVLDGINIVRSLLLLREDQKPGMIVDRKCKILIDGFLGGYTRDEVTDEPIKDGFYEHPQDALRYGVINIFNPKNCDVMKPQHPYYMSRKEANVYTGY